MSDVMEVPQIVDLAGMCVEVKTSSCPGVVSVTAWANDWNVVTLTWDELSNSVGIRWWDDTRNLLILEREAVSRVSIRDISGRIEFWVATRSNEVGGNLVVSVGDHVVVTDTLLRKESPPPVANPDTAPALASARSRKNYRIRRH